MASVVYAGPISSLETELQAILDADSIQPGSDGSYQLYKTIFLYHVLGFKIAASPVIMAQSQDRIITIQKGPEERCAEAFRAAWEALDCDRYILNAAILSRVYGISAVIVGTPNLSTEAPLDLAKMALDPALYFNLLDPLNTAGSLVLNQDANAPDFMKPRSVQVNGKPYHPSRSIVLMHEQPIYIWYNPGAFGFVGPSIYQRVLYPLKSFIQTMITDDAVSRKAAVIVAKIKAPGSIIDGLAQAAGAIKRWFIKAAQVGNVISIDPDESIETLDMQNIDKAMTTARENILRNIATGTNEPAQFLHEETFAQGLSEGNEDAKKVANFIERLRKWMGPLYKFFDAFVMYRAWTPDFYATLQSDFPEYKDVPYATAFNDWRNSFSAIWPSLLTEPESKLVEVDDVKLKAVIALIEVMSPELSPANKAVLFQWAADSVNALKRMFPSPLDLDIEDIETYEPPQPMMGGENEKEPTPKPEGATT